MKITFINKKIRLSGLWVYKMKFVIYLINCLKIYITNK